MDLDFVRCPKCRKRVRVRAPHFPFCSHRCRLLDLGSWFAEDYRLSRPASPLLDEEEFLDESSLEGEDPSDGETEGRG